MAFLLDQSTTFPQSEDKMREGTQSPSHWFLISDTGWAALRINPGLHIGESTEGELAVGGINSAHRWLSFRSDDDGVWLAVASDGIRLRNEEKELLERQPLLPGLVLAFPNHRLLVSQDSIVCPAPGLVISVQPQSKDQVERDLLMSKETPEISAPALDIVSERIQEPRKNRSRPAFVLVLLSALILIALPVIVSELEHNSALVHRVEPNLVTDAQPANALALGAVALEVVADPLRAAELRESNLGVSVTHPSSSAPVDSVTQETTEVAASTVMEKISIEASALFGFDSAELSDDAKAVIDKRIKALTGGENPSSITRVEGHTDSTGPEEYNLYLSRLRAKAVAGYIESRVGLGTDSEIEVLGKGESEPLVSNDTQEGRAENRRVDIFAQRQLTR